MPGWIIWGGLAWILVTLIIIALFRGAALLSGRADSTGRNTAQPDALPKNGNRPAASPKVGEIFHSSAQPGRSEGHGASPWC